MHLRMTALLVVLLVSGLAAAVTVYSPGFDAPLYYDSHRIEKNAFVFAHYGLLDTIGIFPQRPLAMMSFYLDFIIAGISPYWFRLANAALLVITSLVVAVFMYIGLNKTDVLQKSSPADRLGIAIFCGFTFLLHPVQIFLVEYIWQRMALMATLFSMLALVAYFGDRPAAYGSRWRNYLLCIVLFLMAMASKETAITLPLTLVLADVILGSGRWVDLRRTIALCAVMLFAAAILASLLERPHGAGGEAVGIMQTVSAYYVESGITVVQALITNCRMLWKYLQLIAVPLPSQLQLISPQTISQGLLEPFTSVFAVAGTLFLAAVGIFLLYLRRLSGFGILFFLVTLAPEAVLVPQYSFFTYRASMPMIGVLCVAADCALILSHRFSSGAAYPLARGCLVTLAFVCLVLLGSVSYMKAQWWGNSVRVWSDIVEGLPEDLRNIQKDAVAHAFNNLGVALLEQGNVDEAIRVQQRALKLIPNNHYAYNSLGLAFMRKKEYETAAASFTRAIEVNPYYAEAYYNLGKSLNYQGKRKEAAEQWSKTIALDSNYWAAYNDLGVIFAQAGEVDRAAELFQAALAIKPDYKLAQQNLLSALTKKQGVRQNSSP